MLRDYPHLEGEDISAALEYAAGNSDPRLIRVGCLRFLVHAQLPPALARDEVIE